MAEQRKPLVQLTGMYENTSRRSGETYYAGYLGSSKIMLFRDKNAEPGKPGWSLCVQEKDPKPSQGQGQGQPQQQGYGQQGYGHNPPPPPAPAAQQSNQMDDDVPF
ncbi:MAG: hypothetical protein HQL95_01820 [Magnetococcales bacterium]|nr:hypothetical protein [Magnetococcales bacterium]